jgi:hypothetical protein
MIDFGAMSRSYGLTPEQMSAVEIKFNELSEAEKASFSEADFQLLLKDQGIDYLKPGSDEPTLPPPSGGSSDTSKLRALIDSGGSATLGGAIMALLVLNAAEQRQANKEIKAAEAEATAQTIEAQAEKMKEKAIVQLVLGIVSGAVTIAGGMITAGKAGAAMGSGMSQADATLYNTKVGGIGQAFGGAATIGNAINQFVGGMYDTEIKKMDAQVERSRANVETLKDFNEALTELIRKSLETSQAMAESANQARTKILG